MLDLLPFAIISDVWAAILVISKGAGSSLIFKMQLRRKIRHTRVKGDDGSSGGTSSRETSYRSQSGDTSRLIHGDQWLVASGNLPDQGRILVFRLLVHRE